METGDPPEAAAAASSSTAEPPEVALVRAQLAQLLDDSAAAPELEPLRTIGAGRFGATRLVRRASDGCLLCSKQIVIEQFTRRRHACSASDALHEVEVLRLLGAACPHIVRFAGAHVADGALHILTEYAENGSLRQLLDRRRDRGEVLGEAEALDLFVQLVSGVRHLHAHKVVHRDIKPGNIFLDRRNLVRLGDFSIAPNDQLIDVIELSSVLALWT